MHINRTLLTYKFKTLGYFSNRTQTSQQYITIVQLIIMNSLLLFILFLLPQFIITAMVTATTSAPNSIYAYSGSSPLDLSPYFNTATTTLNPLTFTLTFPTRTQPSTKYGFGYSIQQINYQIINQKINYSLIVGTKTTTSIQILFYTSNANKINALSVYYVIVQRLFGVYDFSYITLSPNRNLINGQYYDYNLTGQGPFNLTGGLTAWNVYVGIDATLAANKDIDLYLIISAPTSTIINFKISTIATTSFFVTTVVVGGLLFNYNELLALPRSAKFTVGSISSVNNANTLSYSDSGNIVRSYNSIIGMYSHHITNQANLQSKLTITPSTSITAASTYSFSYFALNYLILQFIYCPAPTNYLLVATAQCYDVCPVRYYQNATYNQCDACPTYDCYYCSANGLCSQCSSTVDFRTMNTTTNKCIPIDGYYDDGIHSQAVPCVASNCATCTSPTYCLSCASGKYLTASNTCSSCISNCITCTSSSNCQQCTTFYIFQSSACIINCSISFCISCSISRSTLNCNTCQNGYLLSQNTCIQNCGNAYKTANEECDDGNTASNDGCSSTCLLQSYFYCTLSAANRSTCTSCISNCKTCTSTSSCQECRASYYYVSSNNSCNTIDCSVYQNCQSCLLTACTQCVTSYSLNSQNICKSICGDGIIVGQQVCDDGNKVNNDGCSDGCEVQNYWSCVNSPSVCSLSDFVSNAVTIIKQQASNQFVIRYELFPMHVSAFSSLDWKSIASQTSSLNLTIKQIVYNYDDGSLILTSDYYEALNGRDFTLKYLFPNTAPFVLLHTKYTTTTLISTNNLSLQVYSDSIYSLAHFVGIASLTLSILSIVFILIGYKANKLIAVEMVAICQITYYSLLTIDDLSPTYASLAALKFTNGYNINLFTSYSPHRHFQPLGLTLPFLNNFNLMFSLILLPLLTSVILSLINCLCYSSKNDRLSHFSSLMRGQIPFYGIIFSSYQITISAGIGMTNLSVITKDLMLGVILSIIGLLVMVGYAIISVFNSEMFGQFRGRFKSKSCLQSKFYVLILVIRIISGFILVTFVVKPQTSVLIGLVLIQLVAVIKQQPYDGYNANFRQGLNFIITTVNLSIILLYNYIEPSISSYGIYTPIAILSFIALSLVYNVYYFVKEYKLYKKEESQVMPDQLFNQNSFATLKSKRSIADTRRTTVDTKRSTADTRRTLSQTPSTADRQKRRQENKQMTKNRAKAKMEQLQSNFVIQNPSIIAFSSKHDLLGQRPQPQPKKQKSFNLLHDLQLVKDQLSKIRSERSGRRQLQRSSNNQPVAQYIEQVEELQ